MQTIAYLILYLYISIHEVNCFIGCVYVQTQIIEKVIPV